MTPEKLRAIRQRAKDWDQHAAYAARWEKAFNVGKHAAESEHRRQNA